MKRIDAADLAEEMSRRHRVEAILGQCIATRKKLELRFVHLDHQRVLAAADRAVAGRELREIAFDTEHDGAAMAAAAMHALVPVHRQWLSRPTGAPELPTRKSRSTPRSA